MTIEEAIRFSLEGEAILFLGSGASYGAKNKNGTCFKTADDFANLLLDEIKLEKNSVDLSTAAQLYLNKLNNDGEDALDKLIQILQQEFTASQIAAHHETLARIPWKRIYTTNYDDVIEKAYFKQNKDLSSVGLNSKINVNENIYLHINGSIKRLNKETINNEFKLTDTSYNTNEFNESPWGELFKRDLKTYSTNIFIGFSLKNDLDIKRIIYNWATDDKCIFIVAPHESKANIEFLKQYGNVYNIGITKFCELIDDAQKTFVNKKDDTLENTFFTNFIEYKRQEIINKPNDNQVLDYYRNGERGIELYSNCKNKYQAIIKRSEINNIIKDINDGIDIAFIHSDLGNGKTEFIEQIKHEISNKFRIFELCDNNNKIEREVEIICKNKSKKIVIIENYFNYKDVFEHFNIYSPHNTTFLFSARTSIYKSTYEKFVNNFKIKEYDVNSLNEEEIYELTRIFNEYGYYFKESSDTLNIIKTTCKKKLQNILLSLFDSKDISKRFISVLLEIKKEHKTNYYKFLLFTILIRVMSLEVNFFDLMEIFEISSLDYEFTKNPAVNELIDFHSRKISIKSSILALWLLKQGDVTSNIIDVLVDTAFKLNQSYRVNKKYEKLLGNIISAKHLGFIFEIVPNKNDKKILITSFYERIKNLDCFQNKYFFWLQYAMSALAIGDFDGAEMHFSAAYAKIDEKLTPFEINNHYARLKLEKLLDVHYYYNEHTINEITEVNRLLTPTNMENDDEYYCYKVSAQYYPSIYKKFFKQMKNEEQNLLREISNKNYKRCSEFINHTTINFYDQLQRFASIFLNLSFFNSEEQNVYKGKVISIDRDKAIIAFNKNNIKQKGILYRGNFSIVNDNLNDLITLYQNVNIILKSYNSKTQKWEIELVS